MKVAEIFYGIQGESTYAGLPCAFVRLVGCNLRCSYCDTQYAYEGGREMNLDEIVEEVEKHGCPLVEITGGEPLLKEDVYRLMDALLECGYRVLLETNGSLDARRVDRRVVRIIDLKCPDSGESDKIFLENLRTLRKEDEIKFVLSSRRDYDWSKGMIRRYSLLDRANVLLSVAYGRLDPKQVVDWMLEDRLNARFQLQMHKYIWGPDRRGV